MTDRDDDILATASASPPRRFIAALVLVLLGMLLLILASDAALGLSYQAFYIALGLGANYGAWRLWQATADVLELTRHELRTASGRVLAEVDNIKGVERGALAFKPSNGFLVRLKVNQDPRGWAPGLWWRVGKSIGVGGVVSAGEAKAMAEILTALISGMLPDDD